MTVFPQLFHIHTDDKEIEQKGRIVQGLVVLLTLAALLRAFFVLAETLTSEQGFGGLIPSFAQLTFAPLVAIICLLITRKGHPVLAAHIFFITLNLVFFFLLIRSAEEFSTFPYLMLISVVAIAALDSVRASMIYAAVVITAVFLDFYLQNFTFNNILAYGLTAVGISLASWVTAQNLQRAIQTSNTLAKDLQQQTTLLQKRTNALQRSTEISQMIGISLNLDDLLRNIVHAIQDQFGFYHVSIFLLGERKQNLYLREASGEIGQLLKSQQHQQPVNEQSIIGWSAFNRKVRVAQDVSQDPIFSSTSSLPQTQAELALPLIARGQLLGVLDVHHNQVSPFQGEDIAALQIVTNQIATQIDNARLFAQATIRLNETQILLSLNTLLTSTLDVGEIYRRASRTFTEQLNITRCVLSTWEKEANTVTTQVEFIHDLKKGIVDEYDLEVVAYDLVQHPGTQNVLQTLQPLVRFLDDPMLEESEKQILQGIGQYTCLELPLARGKEAIGIVELFRNHEQPPFNPAEIQLAQAMANQTAIALQNAGLTSEMQVRVAQLSSLNRLSRSLAIAPTLKDIFNIVRREILSLVEATGMSIILIASDGEHLRWIYGFEYGKEVDLSNIPPLPITQGFSGYVARTREVLLVNKDMDVLSQQFQSFNVGAQTSCWLGVPLLVANNLIGVMSVENELDDNAFGEREVELLKTFAGSVAIAINNFLQFEEIQTALTAQSEQRLQLQTAAEVAAATTSILNLNELINKAVHLIKERFSLYYVGLFLNDSETKYAMLKAGTGEAGQVQLEQKHQLPIGGRSLIGGATADGHPRITQDVQQDSEWRPNPHLPQTRSELALPLRVRDEIIGALTVQSEKPDAFTPELISTLQTMSDQLAVAIRNVQLLADEAARAQRQRQLNQISTRLHRSADVNKIISIGLQALSQRLSGAEVSLTIGRPDTDRPEPEQTNGAKTEELTPEP